MVSFFEFWVSFKYLFPKTREKFFSLITLFSFLGIALGVATLIIVMSVMNGFREELTSKILGINGHLKIQPTFNQTVYKYNDVKSLILENIPNSKVHEIVTSQGLITYKKYSNGVLIKGVSEDFFNQRKIFTKRLLDQSLKSFKNNEGILVGEKLKKKLNLEKGDYITILSSKSYETFIGNIPRSASFKIIGFFDVGMYEYDTSLVFMPIKMLQNFLNYGKKIDYLEVVVEDFENIDSKKTTIKNIIPKYFRIIDWRELNPSLFNAIEVERNVMFLILSLIIIVAAFNLISSMMILVSTKKKDIGVLRVLGVSKFQLLKIFMMNGILIGFFGTLLGLILALLFCLNINEKKTFLEFLFKSDLFSEEIYFFSRLPIILDVGQILKIISMSSFLSFIATIYPSIRATKIEPINLIKWD
ncbi:MAG: lipoprotein-releasing ABC transporter permease subunit [Pseudomonadota bacterium]|nr:lipoprotein-releasing ABC transporter permease subunit [Pseudomonadota bacterium]